MMFNSFFYICFIFGQPVFFFLGTEKLSYYMLSFVQLCLGFDIPLEYDLWEDLPVKCNGTRLQGIDCPFLRNSVLSNGSFYKADFMHSFYIMWSLK